MSVQSEPTQDRPPVDDELVIDGDGHYVEPPEVWTEYLARRFRDRIRFESGASISAEQSSAGQARIGMLDDVVDTVDSSPTRERFVVGDFATWFAHPGMPFSVGDAMTPRGLAASRQRGRALAEAERGGFDASARLAVHDSEGINAAVLFPTLGLFFSSITEPDLAAGACEAVNRWAADYCSTAPDELYAVANLPTQDPGAAAAELRRCVDSHGFVAGMVIPNPVMGTRRTIDDRELEILWDAAEDLDVPICFHTSTNLDPPTAGSDRVRSFLLAHAVAHPFEQMLALGSLVQGGVLDRHRRLRVGFMECNASWLPWWLARLDEHCELMGWMLPNPPTRSPSEMFREQCVIGCESEEPYVGFVQGVVGDDRVMWASDFPHFDCEVPGMVHSFVSRDDLSEEGRAGAISGCAIDFYRLDASRIRRARDTRQAAGDSPVSTSG